MPANPLGTGVHSCTKTYISLFWLVPAPLNSAGELVWSIPTLLRALYCTWHTCPQCKPFRVSSGGRAGIRIGCCVRVRHMKACCHLDKRVFLGNFRTRGYLHAQSVSVPSPAFASGELTRSWCLADMVSRRSALLTPLSVRRSASFPFVLPPPPPRSLRLPSLAPAMSIPIDSGVVWRAAREQVRLLAHKSRPRRRRRWRRVLHPRCLLPSGGPLRGRPRLIQVLRTM